jgi:serine/threonine-protein kinase
MGLPPGVHLGPYEVIGPLGAGGMGEVYKARDVRLGRIVAIKVMVASGPVDADRRARLTREAQIVARLAHPNICSIFDVGYHDDAPFLVLEYVEGETLASRLTRAQPLLLDETMRIARQIAEALAAAHRAAIVHRDLKPANVMLTKTGVKVLDFGLAKLLGGDSESSTVTDASALAITDTGAVVGTWSYMAPEQVEGRVCDARSDLFAFGAIVYEMATGRRAFAGSSPASVAAAILHDTPPPVSAIRPEIPVTFERLVMKCLAKDPDVRWQSASDVADELRWQSTSSTTHATRATHGRPRVGSVGWLALGTALMIAAAALWSWRSRNETRNARVPDAIHERVTSTGEVTAVSLSRDGQWITYATGRRGTEQRVVVRDLPTRQELEVWKGTSVNDLKWLPNNAQIAIAGVQPPNAGLFLVSRLGGPSRFLGTTGGFIAISPDGSRIATADQDASHGIDIGPLDGLTKRRIRLDGVQWLTGLDWSTSARLLLPIVSSDGSVGVLQKSVDTDEQRVAFKSESQSVLSVCGAPGREAFYVLSEGRVERVRFLSGVATPPDLLATSLPPAAPQTPLGHCTVSVDGRLLVYVRQQTHSNIAWMDLTRADTHAVSLTKGTDAYEHPQISRDGQWVLYSTGVNGEIFKAAVGRGERIALTKGRSPLWSPGGERLGFISDRRGKPSLWIAGPDGGGADEVSGAQLGPNESWTWLSDTHIAWQTSDARNYQIRDLRTGSHELLINNPAVGWVFVPRMSPRGDTVAVYWNRREPGLWLISWPDRVERFLAADLIPDGWSRDAAWIYAHRRDSREVVRVSTATGIVERVAEFSENITRFDCDVGRDGTALACRVDDSTSDAWLIRNFDPDVGASR